MTSPAPREGLDNGLSRVRRWARRFPKEPDEGFFRGREPDVGSLLQNCRHKPDDGFPTGERPDDGFFPKNCGWGEGWGLGSWCRYP